MQHNMLPRPTARSIKPRDLIVIGGGGVGGAFALGALTSIRYDLPVTDFVGNSIGGIIATILSLGYTPGAAIHMFTSLAESVFSEKNLLGDLGPSGAFSIKSKYGNGPLRDALTGIFGDITFNDLPTRCGVAATNTNTGRVEILSDDFPVVPSLLATSAAPSWFPPVEIDGVHYVDGGLGANVPVGAIAGRFRDYETIFVIPSSGGYPVIPLSGDWNLTMIGDLIDQMMSIQKQIAIQTASALRPDAIIIDTDKLFELDAVHTIPELVELGKDAATRNLRLNMYSERRR